MGIRCGLGSTSDSYHLTDFLKLFLEQMFPSFAVLLLGPAAEIVKFSGPFSVSLRSGQWSSSH